METLHQLSRAVSARRRVLVVEDNLDSVHSMAILVKMMGHEVQFAINGFAALAVAREFRPHVVLLDLGLPDFNGCEVARQLRFEEALRNTRFIAISALPEPQYRPLALKAGCDEFYAKPIDPQVLERLLANAGPAGAAPP
ncbi:MAG TPA: response regulator [Burkholderiales bacterium]|jgi:two-component system CheB/CheR fusion protein